MNIGERVKKLRKSLGLTQADFAARLGISQGFLSKVEKDQANFTLDHIIAIGNIFQIDTASLIQGETFIVKELRVPYAAPTPASKAAAIKRIVVLLEGMTDERVFEVLKYTEEKSELIFLQMIGRGSRTKDGGGQE